MFFFYFACFPVLNGFSVVKTGAEVFAPDDRMVLSERPLGARPVLDPQQLHLHGHLRIHPQQGQYNSRGERTCRGGGGNYSIILVVMTRRCFVCPHSMAALFGTADAYHTLRMPAHPRSFFFFICLFLWYARCVCHGMACL